MFKVKSSVQALDPVCGIWLSATILELEEDRAKVKWLGYPKSAASFLNFSKVRSPVLKRQYRPRKEDWPRREPRNLQKGDVVYYKMPDGSSTIVTIDENDPWNCWGNSTMSSRRGSPLNQKRSPEEAPKTVVAKKTKVVKEGGSTMSGRRGTLTKGPAEASKTVAKTKKVTKERATTIALEPAVKIIAMEGQRTMGQLKT